MSPRKEPRKGPLPADPKPSPEVAAIAPPPGVPERKSSSVAADKGPHWKGRGIAAAAIARKAREAKTEPRDYIAEAKATLAADQQTPFLIGAVVNAQALDRLGKTMIEAAAIASYKRD